MEEAYHNAYLLLIGETTYDELAEQEEFYLPENHEDPQVVLAYYESIEDYEKCKKIIERNS
jgi:ribonucleotide monophosphatase NagD (HAD superfamily)